MHSYPNSISTTQGLIALRGQTSRLQVQFLRTWVSWGADNAYVSKLNSYLKLSETDAKESKRFIFVGCVVNHANVKMISPQ